MQVHLIGHSAGGWLARAFLADLLGPGSTASSPIATLVTLGTPHVPPCHSSARDMTGGALRWVNQHWPGEACTWQPIREQAPLIAYACMHARGCQGPKHLLECAVMRCKIDV